MVRIAQHVLVLTVVLLLTSAFTAVAGPALDDGQVVPQQQVTVVGGIISADTLWTSDKVYHATGSVIVSAGATLTIQPGTTVKFDPGKLLAIRGALIADGTPARPIVFTAWSVPDLSVCSDCPGAWGDFYQGYRGGVIFMPESLPAQFGPGGDYISGSVLRHAVIEYSFGGVQVGRAAPFIDSNLIWKNLAGAITCTGSCSSQLIMSRNRIIDNLRGNEERVVTMFAGQATLERNLIANNDGIIYIYGDHRLIDNTVVGNTGAPCSGGLPSGLCIAGGGLPVNAPEIRGNNFVGTRATYELALGTGAEFTSDISAPGNYWGTTDGAEVQALIFDSADSINASTFTVTPFLNAPNPAAPPFLDRLTISPPGVVGLQLITFDLNFSRPMDQGVRPSVTFGSTAPYTRNVVLDGQWLSSTTWRATFSVTPEVRNGSYTVAVSGAKDVEGAEIPTNTRFTFAVSYPGGDPDLSPPSVPSVVAAAIAGEPSAVSMSWSASDPESGIAGYRYAIGSAPGGTEVVGWTATTSSSVSRTGLGMLLGQRYWVAVQARNAAGLWSQSGSASFVAGQESLQKLYLPLVKR